MLALISFPVLSELPIQSISLPPGFKIEIFAANVTGARSMAFSEGGVLYVGTRAAGNVYAINDRNGDYIADDIVAVAKGLNVPNGVAVKDGALFVAENSRILRYDDIDNSFRSSPKPEIILDGLPRDRLHGWKYIGFGPDGKLYVPIGAPCNICDEKDKRYASLTRINPDGSGFEIFAGGIRNTVGFDWHPETAELWFTDNGRDWLGDDLPPDELNRAPEEGLHFGFPYLHGKDIPDPQFGRKIDDLSITVPAIELGPHVAALGMKFYTGNQFPPEYVNKIFIAEHGSWNRSTPIGYRISIVSLHGEKAVSYEPFAEGWLDNGKSWGRPVDILMLPDGSLLISDDKANAIYRISYSGM